MNIGINVTVECQVCGWCISYKNTPNLEAAQAWFENHIDKVHPDEPASDEVKVFIAT